MPTLTKTKTKKNKLKLPPGPKPNHVGIILDGNRRWAKKKGWPAIMGHEQGARQIQPVIETIFAAGVNFLSLFVFSTENWRRSQDEVGQLMELIDNNLKEVGDWVLKSGHQLRIAGEIDNRIDPEIVKAVKKIEEKTKDGPGSVVIVCFNYGGQQEIVSAAKKLLEKKVDPKEVTVERLSAEMYLPDTPSIDLIIRTSGEKRLSGFQLWRSAYAEIIFEEKFWPDFGPEDAIRALIEYQQRQRRFGGG